MPTAFLRRRFVPLSICVFAAWSGIAGLVGHADENEIAWELGPTGTKVSFRGISAVSDDVVWICGSDSTVLRSLDAGSSWENVSPPGFGELQFRSMFAWNDQRACIASAGTPAIILRTTDGGDSWQEVFRDDSPKAFLDGLEFWDNQRGIAFGDPVEDRIFVVVTNDGGQSWRPVHGLPQAKSGEAGFAASDSSMIVGETGAVWIGTGGAIAESSRVLRREQWGAPWEVADCPIPSAPTQGVFSIAKNGKQLVAVGGDFRPEAHSPATAAFSLDGGKGWERCKHAPGSFRSAVVHLTGLGWVTTGPSGSDISIDGTRWKQFSETGFHALAVGRKRIFAVGSDGRFAVLRVP